jgi:coenzyme F420-reducing hydrogenase delta subunit
MACTCTEEKEILADGIIIGKNRVVCDECKLKAIEEDKKQRLEQIKNEISVLEMEAIRPMREVMLGTNTSDDVKALNSIVSKIQQLREEYRTIKPLKEEIV